MLRLTCQAEGPPGRVWEKAVNLNHANLQSIKSATGKLIWSPRQGCKVYGQEGTRGRLITIAPGELSGVKIQVTPQGKVILYTPSLSMFAKALTWAQVHLKIWMTEAAQIEPTIYTQPGIKRVANSATYWIRPRPGVLEEHRHGGGGFRMTWRTVEVAAFRVSGGQRSK